MRPLSMLGWAVISGLLWGVAYPGIGYLGGSSWELARDLSGGFGFVILLAAAAVAYALFRRHMAKQTKSENIGPP